MPFIETDDGTRLLYKDRGTGEPVLSVNGWVLGTDTWGYQGRAGPLDGVPRPVCLHHGDRGRPRRCRRGPARPHSAAGDNADLCAAGLDLPDRRRGRRWPVPALLPGPAAGRPHRRARTRTGGRPARRHRPGPAQVPSVCCEPAALRAARCRGHGRRCRRPPDPAGRSRRRPRARAAGGARLTDRRTRRPDPRILQRRPLSRPAHRDDPRSSCPGDDDHPVGPVW